MYEFTRVACVDGCRLSMRLRPPDHRPDARIHGTVDRDVYFTVRPDTPCMRCSMCVKPVPNLQIEASRKSESRVGQTAGAARARHTTLDTPHSKMCICILYCTVKLTRLRLDSRTRDCPRRSIRPLRSRCRNYDDGTSCTRGRGQALFGVRCLRTCTATRELL